VEDFHRTHVPDAPAILFEVLDAQRERLLMAEQRLGDYIRPESFLEKSPVQV
jgi:hypothetical protein